MFFLHGKRIHNQAKYLLLTMLSKKLKDPLPPMVTREGIGAINNMKKTIPRLLRKEHKPGFDRHSKIRNRVQKMIF